MKGFKAFILRGNVVDLAVAFVIGAAFTAIVQSLVTNIINPLISSSVGVPDFSHFFVNLNGGIIKYGLFVNAVIYFLIVAFVLYFFVVLPTEKLMARYKKTPPPTPPTTKQCPQCLSDIPLEAKRCSHCTQLIA